MFPSARIIRKGRSGMFAVTAVAACLIVTACGDNNKSTASSGGSSSSASSPSSTSASKKHLKIALEQVLTGVQFATDTQAGAKAFASQDGAIDLTLSGPPTVDPTTAQSQVQNLLAQQPDAMGVTPFPASVWQRTLKTAAAQVHALVTFNTKPVDVANQLSSAVVKTFVGVNDTQIASDLAAATVKAAGLGPNTTGNVLVGQCVPGNAGTLFERATGFKNKLSALLPKTKVVVFDSKVDPQGNTDAWTQKLQATSNVVLATGTCDQDGTSLYKIKKQNGGKYAVGALETPPENLKGLKDGTTQAVIATNWYLEGYATTKLLADAARGGAAIPEGFIDIGYATFTKANVADLEARIANPDKWYAPKVQAFFANLQSHVHPLASAYK